MLVCLVVVSLDCFVLLRTQVKAAEAEAEAKYLSGVGVSRQRKAIVDGLRDSVDLFSKTIDGAVHDCFFVRFISLRWY